MTENGTDILGAILELRPPWRVAATEVDIDRRHIRVCVDFQRGGRFRCSACGSAGAAVHDSAAASYRLQDGGLAGWLTTIRARVPRVRCSSCGRVRRVALPWAQIAHRQRQQPRQGEEGDRHGAARVAGLPGE